MTANPFPPQAALLLLLFAGGMVLLCFTVQHAWLVCRNITTYEIAKWRHLKALVHALQQRCVVQHGCGVWWHCITRAPNTLNTETMMNTQTASAPSQPCYHQTIMQGMIHSRRFRCLLYHSSVCLCVVGGVGWCTLAHSLSYPPIHMIVGGGPMYKRCGWVGPWDVGAGSMTRHPPRTTAKHRVVRFQKCDFSFFVSMILQSHHTETYTPYTALSSGQHGSCRCSSILRAWIPIAL